MAKILNARHFLLCATGAAVFALAVAAWPQSQPILMNNIGEGTPDVHSGLANNQFLDTRGLPAPVTGIRANDILQRMADASKPFGTTFVRKGDTAEIQWN